MVTVFAQSRHTRHGCIFCPLCQRVHSCLHPKAGRRDYQRLTKNNSRTFGVYFFVNKVNRDRYPVGFVPVKLTIPIRAENFDGLLVSINVKVLILETAERASKKLLVDMVSCASCRLRIISLFNKLIKLVGALLRLLPRIYTARPL